MQNNIFFNNIMALFSHLTLTYLNLINCDIYGAEYDSWG